MPPKKDKKLKELEKLIGLLSRQCPRCSNPVLHANENCVCCLECRCPVENCNECIVSKSKYCDDHTCNIKECKNQKSENFTYCKDHKCKDDSCDKRRLRANLFCEDHKCIIKKCKNPKVDVNNEFCNEHGCVDCGKKRGSYPKTPTVHCNEHIKKRIFTKATAALIWDNFFPGERKGYCMGTICNEKFGFENIIWNIFTKKGENLETMNRDDLMICCSAECCPNGEVLYLSEFRSNLIDNRERYQIWDSQFSEHRRFAICPLCEKETIDFISANWDRSHVDPTLKGTPDDTPANERPLCKSCNISMSNTHMVTYIEETNTAKKAAFIKRRLRLN